jgi:hypothetical protein
MEPEGGCGPDLPVRIVRLPLFDWPLVLTVVAPLDANHPLVLDSQLNRDPAMR